MDFYWRLYKQVLQGGNKGEDILHGELQPLVEGDVAVAVGVHGFEGLGTFVGRGVGSGQAQPEKYLAK